jgi:predicted DNA-binding transcriptional regulator YafY
MPNRYFDRLHAMDRLIRTKATGTPRQFAQNLRISPSRLYAYLRVMKEHGAPIEYCKHRQSYYYSSQGVFMLRFIDTNTTNVAS